MTPDLDAITGMLCLICCSALCLMHVITSPKRGHWLTLPPYVRVGLFALAMCLLFRGVNLVTLAGAPATIRGHINAEGLIAALVLTYFLCALAVHWTRKAYPAGFWRRLSFAEKLAASAHPILALAFLKGVHIAPDRHGFIPEEDDNDVA